LGEPIREPSELDATLRYESGLRPEWYFLAWERREAMRSPGELSRNVKPVTGNWRAGDLA
jgi:hypothetical protein